VLGKHLRDAQEKRMAHTPSHPFPFILNALREFCHALTTSSTVFNPYPGSSVQVGDALRHKSSRTPGGAVFEQLRCSLKTAMKFQRKKEKEGDRNGRNVGGKVQ